MKRLDPKDLGKSEFKLAKAIKGIARDGLDASEQEIAAYMKSASSHVRDRGLFQNGWRCSIQGLHLTIYNEQHHAIFVEGGRSAGARPPPLEPIRGWLLRHGMDPKLAFVVARAIGQRGIKPRPISRPSLLKITAIVMKNLGKSLGSAIKRLF